MMHEEVILLNEVDGKTPEEKSQLQLQALSVQLKQENKNLLSQVKNIVAQKKNLEDEIDTIQTRLNEANLKYRKATEQIIDLKNKIVQLEESEKFVGVLKTERDRLGGEIEALRRQGEEKVDILQSTEKELIRVQTELDGVKERLNDANMKYRTATEQITTLKEKREFENSRYITAVEQIAVLKERVAIEESAHERVQTALEETRSLLEMERDRLGGEIEALRRQGEEKVDILQSTEKELIRVQTELDGVKERLNDANMKYRTATEQIVLLKGEAADAKQMIDTLNNEMVQVKENLASANEKYRFQVGEVVPKLKDEIKLNQLKTKRLEDEYKRKIELINQKKDLAELQVAKVRATLSFQIGYQIVQGLKTWKGTMGLPIKLWKIHQEFKARKQMKTDSSYIPKPIFQTVVNNRAEKMPISRSTTVAAQPKKKFTGSLKEYRVACIMDQFTYSSYAPECELHQLTPENWNNELESCNPELLFIESAWRGKDDLWGNKVGHASQEVQEIVGWCKTREIPTVFWNKEDPIHFETFLNTARLFDYVFTTDIDCIHRYKGSLGHERVYLLPFAAQPAVNNPIEKYDRKDAFCFAGAYYVRYPDRTRDLGNFVTQLAELKPVEIYDRNYGKNDPNYQFPEEYQPFIVGNLPYEEIDKAYKGYNYAINLNSIKQSQTMFARRVYELLASNTMTISNFSRGVRLMFGDLVITTDSSDEIARRLKSIVSDESVSHRYRLAALRKVMSQHTYADRLNYIVSKIQNTTVENHLPTIAMVAYVQSTQQIDAVRASFDRQHYPRKKLYVVVAEGCDRTAQSSLETRFIGTNEVDGKEVAEWIETDFVAGIVSEDYYGPHYLTDIALATRYSDAGIIGKGARYESEGQTLRLNTSEQRYKIGATLEGRSCALRLDLLSHMNLKQWTESIMEHTYEGDMTLSIDEYNYCKNGAIIDMATITEMVDDLSELGAGIDLDELVERAEAIQPMETLVDQDPFVPGEMLAGFFTKPKSGLITWEIEGSVWQVNSILPDGKHEYLYASREFTPEELNVHDGVGKLFFDTTPGLNLQITLIFLDAQKQKISHVVKGANRNHEFAIPMGTAWIRIGVRVYASGSAAVRGIVWGHRPIRPAQVIGRNRYLLLTNHYPSYDDLYRNGFVHSRVKAYKDRGVDVDVFRLRPNEQTVSYHEFHDVDVITGSSEALRQLIEGGAYESILVHFLDEAMWEVLREFIDHIPVIVWIHGAEIQPWHRRDYNYSTEEERNDAKKQSGMRMAFWHSVLQPMPSNLLLIFVSHYFAEEVMEDLGFRIPNDHYAIIHNPIDTELFKYEPKLAGQRKRILSIRPYASAKYANDLSVNAVLALQNKPFFHELEFRFIGDGPLFEETLAPLRHFDNVIIERGFLTQPEIAKMHRLYGIFLSPTRMDAQGVSRDEAMASGLVPVTNAVAAIPEFVDDDCGILAKSENFSDMAEGIEKLYNEPQLFLQMSQNAANRVRSQSDASQIIVQEIYSFTHA